MINAVLGVLLTISTTASMSTKWQQLLKQTLIAVRFSVVRICLIGSALNARIILIKGVFNSQAVTYTPLTANHYA